MFHNKPRISGGYTLMELSVVLAISAVVGVMAYSWFSQIERGDIAYGRKTGEQMRSVYAKQRMFLIEQELFAATPSDPATWTWDTLYTATDAAARFPNIDPSVVSVNVLPPVSSKDGMAKGDLLKTSPTNGDGVNDIGRER